MGLGGLWAAWLCTFRGKGEEELGWLGLSAHEVFVWLVFEFEFEFEWPIQIQIPPN
jgi:hypothetical protein